MARGIIFAIACIEISERTDTFGVGLVCEVGLHDLPLLGDQPPPAFGANSPACQPVRHLCRSHHLAVRNTLAKGLRQVVRREVSPCKPTIVRDRRREWQGPAQHTPRRPAPSDVQDIGKQIAASAQVLV